jgi:hypothetical protein
VKTLELPETLEWTAEALERLSPEFGTRCEKGISRSCRQRCALGMRTSSAGSYICW